MCLSFVGFDCLYYLVFTSIPHPVSVKAESDWNEGRSMPVDGALLQGPATPDPCVGRRTRLCGKYP